MSFVRETRADAVVHVVGEYYRQAMISLARPPGPTDLPPGLPPPPSGHYKALLMPEPKNRYDPNAIMVLLWAGRHWVHVGYLSRESAIEYQPVFAYLGGGSTTPAATKPHCLACDAALIRERDGMGVVLNLGTPAEIIADLWIDDHPLRTDHPWHGRLISFTGAERTAIAGAPIDRHAQRLLARRAGCLVAPRVTKKVEALVAADDQDETANLLRAREYGIPIVREVDFLIAIGLDPELVSRAPGRWVRG
ncbi:MAG TPA: HIRAN domain-containing protein [Candidatus Binatia bacterium]|nr:HIRAN domain-containing protein [Candidatus Binatia bacterium]